MSRRNKRKKTTLKDDLQIILIVCGILWTLTQTVEKVIDIIQKLSF